jgi:trypsin
MGLVSPLVACAGATLAVVLGSCAAPSQVSFLSNERPSAQGVPQGRTQPPVSEPPRTNVDLPPPEEELVEPDRPAVETKQERALVHVHGPKGVVCSGVVIGPRLVATAQQCLKDEGKGATALGPTSEYRVEVASSTLTWTNRRVKYAVLPKCDWNDLDVAILVLADAIDWVAPLRVVSAPGTGARVQALGFGRCKGASTALKERVGTVRSRASESLVIELVLCKGDVGGPVIDGREGEVIGLISHRDDPEGSPLTTTTIARLDTPQSRELLVQAKRLADGIETTKLQSVACR